MICFNSKPKTNVLTIQYPIKIAYYNNMSQDILTNTESFASSLVCTWVSRMSCVISILLTQTMPVHFHLFVDDFGKSESIFMLGISSSKYM